MKCKILVEYEYPVIHKTPVKAELILHGDKVISENIKPYIEENIVKPYLDRLKAKMEERDDDNGGEPLNAVDRGYHLAFEHLCKEIDNLLADVR